MRKNGQEVHFYRYYKGKSTGYSTFWYDTKLKKNRGTSGNLDFLKIHWTKAPSHYKPIKITPEATAWYKKNGYTRLEKVTEQGKVIKVLFPEPTIIDKILSLIKIPTIKLLPDISDLAAEEKYTKDQVKALKKEMFYTSPEGKQQIRKEITEILTAHKKKVQQLRKGSFAGDSYEDTQFGDELIR